MADITNIDIGSKKGLFLSISLPGAQGFRVALSRFGDDLPDFTAFWEGKFKTFWYALRQVDYASAGAATGGSWPALSPAYRAWKNQHFPTAPLLVLRGALKPSITTSSAPGSIWRPTPTGVSVGSSVPYALYHQTGTRTMPARPPIRFADVDRQRLGKLLQEFVVDSWKKRRTEAA